jgi:hypothetical protein
VPLRVLCIQMAVETATTAWRFSPEDLPMTIGVIGAK